MEKNNGITYPSQILDPVEKKRLPFHTKIRRFYPYGEDIPAAGADTSILTTLRKKKNFTNKTKTNISFIDNYCYAGDSRDYTCFGFGKNGLHMKSLRHFPEKHVSVVENECIIDNPAGIHPNFVKNAKVKQGGDISNIKLENLVNGVFCCPNDHIFTKKGFTKDKNYLKFHDLSCILANAYYNDFPSIEKKKSKYGSCQNFQLYSREKLRTKANPLFTQYSLETNGSFLVPKSSSLTLDEKKRILNRCNRNTSSHLSSSLLPSRSTRDMWIDQRPSKTFFQQTSISMMHKNSKMSSEHKGVRFFHKTKNSEGNK